MITTAIFTGTLRQNGYRTQLNRSDFLSHCDNCVTRVLGELISIFSHPEWNSLVQSNTTDHDQSEHCKWQEYGSNVRPKSCGALDALRGVIFG